MLLHACKNFQPSPIITSCYIYNTTTTMYYVSYTVTLQNFRGAVHSFCTQNSLNVLEGSQCNFRACV